MDAFFWMMDKTKHIPEYGLYSGGQNIIRNVYIILLNVVICFMYRIYFIVY